MLNFSCLTFSFLIFFNLKKLNLSHLVSQFNEFYFTWCLFIFRRSETIHILHRLFYYLIQVSFFFWQSFFHRFEPKSSFLQFSSYLFHCKCFPIPKAVENMSTLDFLFKPNTFFCLNSWSVLKSCFLTFSFTFNGFSG